MKNNGSLDLNAKSSEKFLSPNVDLFGALESSYFTAKSTSLLEYTSFEPLRVKFGWGLASRAGRKKSESLGLP